MTQNWRVLAYLKHKIFSKENEQEGSNVIAQKSQTDHTKQLNSDGNFFNNNQESEIKQFVENVKVVLDKVTPKDISKSEGSFYTQNALCGFVKF